MMKVAKHIDETTNSTNNCSSYLLWREACHIMDKRFNDEVDIASTKATSFKYGKLERMSAKELEFFIESEKEQDKHIRRIFGRNAKRDRSVRFTPEMIEDMARMKEEGMSYTEIAAQYEMSSGHCGHLVRKYLKENT